MNSPLDTLSQQELAVLYVTRESDRVQTLLQLAQTVEAPAGMVGETIDGLVQKLILREVDSVDEHGNDAICYGYHNESDISQRVYEAVHNVEPI